MKKRISAILLTLALSISMLAPEFSMLPAVYAEDEAPAAEQTVESAGASAGEQTDGEAGSAAEGGAASKETIEPDAAGPGADTAESAGDAIEEAEPEAAAEEEQPADTAETGAYSRIYFETLNEKGALVIPDDLKDKIKVSQSEYGDCILLKGKVSDLNALRLMIDKEFDFDSGSVGRLSFDGLRDKDAKMTVNAQVYMDDSAEPVSEFALNKQMGKKDWANEGEKSVSLGEKPITGKHKAALGFKINGKADDDKTTVAIRSLQFCRTTLPVLYFNIDESEGTVAEMNSSSDHSVECYGDVDLIVPDAFNSDETFRDEYGRQKSLKGLTLEYVRGRGNSTWMDDKKPYKVKFDKKQNLFGFGANKHWVLLANRYDNSFVRNRMTYWLGQQLGMEYTPQCVPVEVVMNGEFMGSYLLCEQIRVGKGRVTIDDLDDVASDSPAVTDPEIQSGGYLLSMDFEEDEARSFTTENGMNLFIESPDKNVKLFSEYIKAYIQKVENAIFSDDFKDADGNLYTDYLDMDAAVDYWWIQEFSANGDAYGSGSTYLYKKRDNGAEKGKLYWGPLWDFDFVAWGDLDYESGAPEGIDNTGSVWFEMMKNDPEFAQKVKERWSGKGGLKEKLDEITKKGGRLDKYIDQMTSSYEYDHELWGAYESEYTDYKDEIEQLRSWIVSREANVEEALEEYKVEAHNVKFMIDGKTVKEVTAKGMLRERDFPEVPEKPGYVFSCWLSEGEDAEIYEAGSRVTEDLVLNAEYIDENDIVHAKDIFFKSYDVYYSVIPERNGSVDDSYFMDYRVMPDGAAESEIKWSSSDESIAELDEDGMVILHKMGDVTITAELENGVSKSYDLHTVKHNELEEYEDAEISTETMSLAPGEYGQITVNVTPARSEAPDMMWVSTEEDVASVDDLGVVTANGPGSADILALNVMTREIYKCRVTVKEGNVGQIVKYKGNTYEITSDNDESRTVMLIKAKNAKSVVIPAKIPYGGNKYSVNAIMAGAFSKSKARTVTIKTRKLSSESVEGALKGSKVKKIKVRVGKKKVNKKFAKKYRKIFTKKNAGKKAKVN